MDGIVSDDAQTNRRLWIELGVSGSINNVKNSFQNPMDERRIDDPFMYFRMFLI